MMQSQRTGCRVACAASACSMTREPWDQLCARAAPAWTSLAATPRLDTQQILESGTLQVRVHSIAGHVDKLQTFLLHAHTCRLRVAAAAAGD